MSGKDDSREQDGAGAAKHAVDTEAATRLSDSPLEPAHVDSRSGPDSGADAEDEKTPPPPAQAGPIAETEVIGATAVASDDAGAANPLAETRLDTVAPPGGADVDVNAATRIAKRSYASDPNPAEGDAAHSGVQPGSVLFGEYEIIEVLGAGGMGEVYKARHRRLGEFRAIKMMHAALSGKKGANEFFLREAKALLAVRHPAVVHCHDLLSDEQGRVFLIMEMIEGESLADRMEDGPLSPDDVVLLGARLSAGLSAAHECGVVHRDVSPDNVVLPDGDVSRAKLIDFGIAKILQEGQGTIVEGFKGKLSYASPEQLGFFGGKIDGRSDFYSLGLVLCAAALGRPLGMGKTVVEAVDARREFHKVPEGIPIGLRASIEPLLALDPADRPEFVERLFVAPGQAPPEYRSASQPAGRYASERKSMLVPGIIAGVALAAGIGAFVLLGDGPTSAPSATTVSPEPSRQVPAVREPQPIAEARPRTVKTQPPAPPAERVLSPLDKVKIVGLMRGAESALAENRLQSPKGNNAYEKYRAVLALDPNNEEARMGLVHISSRYIALSRSALADGKVEQASDFVSRAASITPHHPDLPDVRAEIDRAGAGD